MNPTTAIEDVTFRMLAPPVSVFTEDAALKNSNDGDGAKVIPLSFKTVMPCGSKISVNLYPEMFFSSYMRWCLVKMMRYLRIGDRT